MSSIPLIDLEPETFSAASAVFGKDIAGGLFQARGTLVSGLADSAAMAGSDPAGASWASSYDPAARATAAAITDLGNACTRLAALLEQTGLNHGMAESASDPTRSVPAPPDRTRYAVMGSDGPFCYAAPPSAAGGSGSGPPGWGLIEHLVGYAWPNGHQDELRAASRTWTNVARTVGGLAYRVPEAVEAISAQRSPEVPAAKTASAAMQRHIADIADACHGLARACSDYAGYLDDAHRKAEHELASLLEWTAGIELGGALLGAVTFGAGEGAAQAAETARVAATARRVASIIGDLVELAGTVAGRVSAVIGKVAGVCRSLRPILGARLSMVTTKLVEELPAIAPTAETSAITGLEHGTSGITILSSSSRTYVVTPRGSVYDIPEGWPSREAENRRGIVFQKPGSIGKRDEIRIMEPTSRYPEGYATVTNSGAQRLDVFGKPGTMPDTHIPDDYVGPWPGWPS